MYLLFDIQANGKPRSWKSELSDIKNWPRLLKLAWIIYDKKIKLVESNELIIKPEGFQIKKSSSDFHGITDELASKNGVGLKETLELFSEAIDKSEYIIAHNFKYKSTIIGAEMLRTSINSHLFSKTSICTMNEGTYFAGIQGRYGKLKWPSLMELFQALYGAKYKSTDKLVTDVQACAKCFFKLVSMEEIDLD